MDLATFTTANGMDSREIAERTGKRHADVCRDIQGMLEQLQEPERNFASGYLDAQGQRRRCFILPKRECLILATGYRVDLRAKIIDRWAELEGVPQNTAPLSRLEILRMAIEAEEKVQTLEAKVQAQAPAVEFVERFVDAEGSYSIRIAAKMIGMPERKFIALLEAQGILYRLSGRLTPAAHHLEKGRFEVKAGEAHGHAYAQPRFTPAGFEWITKRMSMPSVKVLSA